jgi:hypothetical protein
MSPKVIDAIVRGAKITIPVRTAEQILAMQLPPNA